MESTRQTAYGPFGISFHPVSLYAFWPMDPAACGSCLSEPHRLHQAHILLLQALPAQISFVFQSWSHGSSFTCSDRSVRQRLGRNASIGRLVEFLGPRTSGRGVLSVSEPCHKLANIRYVKHLLVAVLSLVRLCQLMISNRTLTRYELPKIATT